MTGAHPSDDDLFGSIRFAARRVAECASFVRIDEAALERFAAELRPALAEHSGEPERVDPAHRPFASDALTLAYVVTLDAINFGSGWFPVLRKRPGCSGYFTIATALEEHFEREGAFSASELRKLDARDCAELFGQDASNSEVAELMGHFSTALHDLGELLESDYDGRFESLVEAAAGSAERLARSLAAMPLYRDVTRYAPGSGEPAFDVPLYKRAQITASDLALAFGGEGPGRFEDLDRLTIFADNLVPHVLRCEGVLVYAEALAARIDRGERLDSGSSEEVEIRAVALHAVERMVAALRAAGFPEADAQRLDHLLWNRGQSPAIKARPRHRARSVFY